MAVLPEHLCGQDVDVLCKYRTPVVVAIRDRRLGALNNTFLLATAAYVFVYQILYNTGYLLVTAPAGGFRFSLREPTNALGCDPVDDEGCESVFPALDEPAYCLQNTTVSGTCPVGSFRTSDDKTCAFRRKCMLMDDLEVAVIEGNELLLTTRISQVAQANTCRQVDGDIASCDALWSNVAGTASDVFVAGLEQFTLLVDHAVRDSEGALGLGDVARNMDGALSIPNNSELCAKLSDKGRRVTSDREGSHETREAPCFAETAVDEANGHDVFTVEEWLGAAGLKLDDFSGDPNHPNESVRARGHVVVITIDYTNIVPWLGASAGISYTYSLTHLSGTSFKLTSSSDVVAANSTNSISRRVQKRYGIKVVVILSGRLGVFDFNTLLLQLAAGSALLGIAALLTDFLAMNVLPERELYTEAKIKHTEDFGDIRLQRQAGFESSEPKRHGVGQASAQDGNSSASDDSAVEASSQRPASLLTQDQIQLRALTQA